MFRLLIAFLAALALGLVAVILFDFAPQTSDGSAAARQVREDLPPQAEEDTRALASVGPARATVDSAEHVGVERASQAPEPELEEAPGVRRIRVLGTVELVDGERRREVSGGTVELEIAHFAGAMMGVALPDQTAVVEDGRFELELELPLEAERLRVHSTQALFDGRDATSTDELHGNFYDVTEADEQVYELVLSMQVVSDPVLVVRAAESGVELQDVIVVPSNESFMASSGTCHPESERRRKPLVDREPSPLRLSWKQLDDDWTSFVYVGAPGREWRQLAVAPQLREGNELEVSLPLAGSVRVDVTGAEGGSGLYFRIFSELGNAPLIERQIGSQLHATFEGVGAGRWIAVVQRGMWFGMPEPLAQVPFDVEVGQQATVELALTAEQAAPPTTFPVELFVRLPRSWGDRLGSWRVQLVRSESPLPVEGDRNGFDAEQVDEDEAGTLWRVPVGELAAGTHFLSTYDHGVGATFVVGGPGPISIDLPGAVRRQVQVLEADGSTPVLEAPLSWTQRVAESPLTGAGKQYQAEATDEPGLYAFEAPAGPLSLMIFGGEYGIQHRTWEPASDGEVFDFVLEARATLLVTLRRDGRALTPTSIGFDRAPKVLDPDGASSVKTFGMLGDAFRMLVPPGTHTVHPPTLDGCAPLEPVQVTVNTGDERDLVFDYQGQD